jgi:ssDNA-binding Zn-finger/Zn-ribbon topoisomerase 1
MNEHDFSLIKLIAEESKNLKPGQEKYIKCPDCGSDLRLSRSSYNGHLWAVCESCGVKFLQ